MKDKAEKLVEEYDLEVLEVRRGRGTYIYETSRGTKVFKPIKAGEERMNVLAGLLERIEAETDIVTGKYMQGRNGVWICENEEGEPCILKDHFEGKEWSMEKESELLQAVEILGQLHTVLRQDCLMQGMPWNEEVEKRNREMRRTRNFMRNQKRKTSFELLFLKVYPEVEKEFAAVMEKLKTSGYEALWERAGKEGQLCHGDFTYHNLVHCGKGAAVLNFESVYRGLQMDDLYHFLRKTMEKNNWNFLLFEKMLERYKNVRPICMEELEYLYLRFCYPEKYWKIANHYQNTRKNRIPEKDMHKLEIFIEQEKEKSRFLESLAQFLK